MEPILGPSSAQMVGLFMMLAVLVDLATGDTTVGPTPCLDDACGGTKQAHLGGDASVRSPGRP
jgi:hypothetical protein